MRIEATIFIAITIVHSLMPVLKPFKKESAGMPRRVGEPTGESRRARESAGERRRAQESARKEGNRKGPRTGQESLADTKKKFWRLQKARPSRDF